MSHHILMQIRTFPGGHSSVFAFWVGMEYEIQEEILRLCSTCNSIDGIAVFRDRKWSNPQQGIFIDLIHEKVRNSEFLFSSATDFCVRVFWQNMGANWHHPDKDARLSSTAHLLGFSMLVNFFYTTLRSFFGLCYFWILNQNSYLFNCNQIIWSKL